MSKVDENRTVRFTVRTTERESELLNSYLEDSIHKDKSKAIREALFSHIREFYSVPYQIPNE